MKKIEKKIIWSFWEIDLEVFQNFWNNKIIFNIHWVFWSKNDPWQRLFAEKIWENNFANVVLFSSSRKDFDYDENISKEENRKIKFSWKTFWDELEDAKIVFKNILENSEKYFWVKKENLEFFVNGNSLGWTLAFFLSEIFPQIKNISTVGTWLRKQKWNFPILDTFPEIEEYKKVLKNFSGKYLMHEAWNDEKFSKESYDEFFKIIWASKKEKIFYPWVNHPFSEKNWEKSKKPFLEVFENFVKYFFNKK